MHVTNEKIELTSSQKNNYAFDIHYRQINKLFLLSIHDIIVNQTKPFLNIYFAFICEISKQRSLSKLWNSNVKHMARAENHLFLKAKMAIKVKIFILQCQKKSRKYLTTNYMEVSTTEFNLEAISI